MNAGSIIVVNSSLVNTFGETSPGISIQSIGGGGGWVAGFTQESSNVMLGAKSPSSSIDSGDILLINKANITTSGLSAGGITAQSIGGGGGLIGNRSG